VTVPHKVAVVGAGTMGAGIARIFSSGGAEVWLTARRQKGLDAARERAGDAVHMTTDLDEALAGVDFVVETIVEDMGPKRVILARAEELAAPEALLTTNTSSLSVDEVGRDLEKPERFAGLHFLNPPELVPVVEIVGGSRTAPGTLETLRARMEELGKAPVVVRLDVPGFVVNRLQYALLREAYALVDAGVCTFEDVDRAVTAGLGARWAAIGPFETMDLAGLDVHAAVAANLWPELATTSKPSGSIAAARERGHIRADFDAEKLKERRDRVLRLLREA
jgi:3-hydroxybutyryl-CoA dehydrogenase